MATGTGTVADAALIDKRLERRSRKGKRWTRRACRGMDDSSEAILPVGSVWKTMEDVIEVNWPRARLRLISRNRNYSLLLRLSAGSCARVAVKNEREKKRKREREREEKDSVSRRQQRRTRRDEMRRKTILPTERIFIQAVLLILSVQFISSRIFFLR